LFATAAQSLEIGVVLLDGSEVTLANDAAVDLRLVRGHSLVAPALAGLATEARRANTRLVREVAVPWGAGDRAVRAVAAPIADSAQTVLLVTDLQETLRVEAVRRDFVANVSHELKTPIGALMLLAEAVRAAIDDPDDPATAHHFADRMVHEAGRLSRLVNELLDLYRLQGAEPLPTLDAVAASDVFDEVAEALHVRADAAGIQLDIVAPGSIRVWGDHRLLVTALTNLIENAIAYSPPGTTVTVRADVRGGHNAQDPEGVEISVRDEGVGIEPSEQRRIFERFYRVDAARSRATGGTGLGLAIVKHIASNHGGRVDVQSAPGQGSTFTLHLPVPPANAASATTSTASAQ
jgi:two-component system sensor histidine kinase SenX3